MEACTPSLLRSTRQLTWMCHKSSAEAANKRVPWSEMGVVVIAVDAVQATEATSKGRGLLNARMLYQ